MATKVFEGMVVDTLDGTKPSVLGILVTKLRIDGKKNGIGLPRIDRVPLDVGALG